MDISQWNPDKVGLVVVLLSLIVLIVRTALTRKWVPGVYFEDMRADRDLARAEAKRATEMLAQLQLAHAEVLYQNSEFMKLFGAQPATTAKEHVRRQDKYRREHEGMAGGE